MNVKHCRCATLCPQASLSSQDIGFDRNRDTVITKRCQNSHSIIESKLKVQFRNCVAHNNLGLALTINCSVRKKDSSLSASSIICLSLEKIDFGMTQA